MNFLPPGGFRSVWKQVSPLDRRSLALTVSPRVKKRKGVVTQLAKTGVVVASVAINIARLPLTCMARSIDFKCYIF